jgi:signal transduction histidine kinase
MFHKLDLRDRLIVVAAVPLAVMAIVVVGLIFINSSNSGIFALMAGIGLVAAAAVSLTVGRSIMATIGGVADEAAALAASRRGQAGASDPAENRSADGATSTGTAGDQRAAGPLVADQSGTTGRLLAAIHDLDRAADEADRSRQDEVREGLRNIVTNLARRSQTLLDRQVEFLDQLENSEENPERLDQLFKVDHLATRMRRNAESLIVLAEADPGRRRGGPVEVADVLRVAMGEVEIYQQIELTSVDQGKLSAANAVDLAHMTAELMENATQFSPPKTPVLVTGRFDGRGSFVITIADQGMGMTDDRLGATNQLLAEPPALGLGMGRSLGFMVVGRLAQRLGASVAVARNEPNAGLTATISVPADAFLATGPGPVPVPTHRTNDDGDTAEMAQPLAPPAATDPASDPDPTGDAVEDPVTGTDTDTGTGTESDTNTELEIEEATSGAVERSAGSDDDADEAVTPFDWGVGSMVDEEDGQADDLVEPGRSGGLRSGPAPDVPLSRSTEVHPGPSTADDTAEIDDIGQWTPPSVTPDAPARLDEAVPTGDAFEYGVASLLDDDDGPATRPPRRLGDAQSTSAGLTKRQRSGGDANPAGDRPVAATKRNPDEVRSRLMRYREGLNGRKPGSGKAPKPKPSERKADRQSSQDRSSNEGRKNR